jgi:peptide/nickel transport system permease protein
MTIGQPLPDKDPGEEPRDVVAGASSTGPAGGEVYGARRSALRRGLAVFAENRLALIGLAILLFFLGFCFLGPHLHPTDQVDSNLVDSNLRPGNGHVLGTDSNGYDELGRLMYGGQASLMVGIAAAVLATVVGTLYGAVSGYVGGGVDVVMMRIVDGVLAIPTLFLLLVLSSIYTPGPVAMVAGRLIRGESLSLRVREYVQAVRAMGGGNGRAIVRHIAPNAIGTVVVFATFTVADSILALAFLGYLGLGLQPPKTDWGAMLSTATNYVNSGYWWLLYPPGLCIILVCVAFNFLGDALRDAFEVRLQSR